MSAVEVACALVIAVGVAGVLVPVLPGSLLVLAGVVWWAWALGTGVGWLICGLATAFLALGALVKYVVPGRRLREAGIPASTLVAGGALGIVGFFVLPVVGLPLGFVAGVYLAELRRVGSAAAWPATRHALAAAGLSVLIELSAAVLASTTWVVGVVVT